MLAVANLFQYAHWWRSQLTSTLATFPAISFDPFILLIIRNLSITVLNELPLPFQRCSTCWVNICPQWSPKKPTHYSATMILKYKLFSQGKILPASIPAFYNSRKYRIIVLIFSYHRISIPGSYQINLYCTPPITNTYYFLIKETKTVRNIHCSVSPRPN